jgi:membrane-bound lytic murein transglycosylase B
MRQGAASPFFAALLAALLLMSVPVSAAAQSFQSFVNGLWPEAQARGVSQATFQQAFAGVAPDPAVLQAASRQPEFVKPVWEYLEGAVSAERMANGRRLAQQYQPLLDAIEARFGVDRYVVLAIWGMESSYGAVLNNPKIVKPVIQSLATLAFQGGQRAAFGREQLLAALQILERGDVAPARMTGSWAGAMGHTQFIPTTYNSYAVDLDGDGRRDIWSSIPDALGSTAHYLRRSGWEPGKTWGYEVALPQGFDYRLADRKTERTLAEWERFGIRRTAGRGFPRPSDRAKLVLPAGARGPAFLMLGNFDAILKYNNSTAYGLGVGHLADRIRGGGDFAQSWPKGERPLSRVQTEEMQRLLSQRGFSTGGVDGKVGPNTQEAVRAYQASVGLTPDGYPTLALLERLQGSTR